MEFKIYPSETPEEAAVVACRSELFAMKESENLAHLRFAVVRAVCFYAFQLFEVITSWSYVFIHNLEVCLLICLMLLFDMVVCLFVCTAKVFARL